jgi:type II restriction/modification system DNA methylase subunit YeeA
MTPQEFAAKWRGVTLKERSSAQEHFLDICRLVGHATPAEADPDGTSFTFERGVEKTGGGSGFADVWYRGHFAWEYKTRHSSLTDAYNQLLQYRENLENPPLLVVCDIGTFEVHTNFTNTVKQVYRFTNDELPDAANIAVLRALFSNHDVLKPAKTLDQVTEEAAADFARLAPMLTSRGVEPHHAAHFLIRVLFCLFAEAQGIGLLPNRTLSRLVEHALTQPEDFEASMRGLFETMAKGGMFGADNLPHFNGGLFTGSDAFTIALTRDELAILLKATKHDWASVEPAIFGTLFERSLDPSKRSQLGAHYTSKADILRIVEPVVLAPLRAEWADVRERAEELAAARDAVYARYRGIFDAGATNARKNADAAIRNELAPFEARLSRVTVLDPACGSGNFLYVTLALLMDLQNEVGTWAADHKLTKSFPSVTPQQLYGFELNPYARELAQVVIWIGYLQWTLAHYGAVADRPILKSMETIAERDAVLDRANLDRANPLAPSVPTWPAVYAIVGNPPFIGGKRMRGDLGDAYVDTLFRAWGGEVARESDFVCYWFEQARRMLAEGKVQRVGLLATNSIRGGANREVLQRIKETGDIFMAWSDEPWILEGAAVRISLVGFDAGAEATRTLDGKPVAAVNADLTANTDLTRARRLAENANIAYMGDTKGGLFDIPADLAARMLAAPLNPNSRPNADVVRPWVNGMDITRRPRNMSIIDFGVDMPIDQAALYEQPFTHVEQHVKPQRDASRTTRAEWWLHERPRGDLRAALAPLHRYIATPTVAKHRLFVWLTRETLPDHQLIAIARDDDYTFGVLHARPHELWSLRLGTSLGVGNDPRYTPSTTFETYPFPAPSEAQREAIAAAARALDTTRNAWLNPPGASEADLRVRTLTNLYNERPAWLRMAHERLDAAVFAAYGWDPSLADDDLLARLLALNLARASVGAPAVATPASDDAQEA